MKVKDVLNGEEAFGVRCEVIPATQQELNKKQQK